MVATGIVMMVKNRTWDKLRRKNQLGGQTEQTWNGLGVGWAIPEESFSLQGAILLSKKLWVGLLTGSGKSCTS